jgi:hypothetical protein
MMAMVKQHGRTRLLKHNEREGGHATHGCPEDRGEVFMGGEGCQVSGITIRSAFLLLRIGGGAVRGVA